MLDTTRALSTSPATAGCPAHRTMPSPTRIASRPRATMWVFEYPGRTCSAQMRIRISSRVRLGTRAALPDSEYLQSVLAGGLWARCSFPPGLSAVYDMHFDSLHCPPPGLAFCSCTTRNAMRSCDHEAVTRVLDAPRAYDFTTRTARRRSSAESPLSLFSARTYAHHNWDVRHHRPAQHPCVHSPSHMPLSSPPARDDRLRRSPTLPHDAAQLPSYHHRPSQRPWWLFLVGGAAFFFCLRTTTVYAPSLRLPGLHSTHEHPHARRPACAALDVVRLQIPKRLSSRTRDVPPRRNYLQVRRAAPPTAIPSPRQSPPRWSVTCAIRRDYQRRHLMRGIAPPMAYHADTLAIVVPYAAFVELVSSEVISAVYISNRPD
ncbi:hypothetical protein B0H14DRAFT_3888104 [Mycena olivaceomarginata]|nr:hypothetical protein B0H14DRAFT_3888104 [Mycena olivaceomarginata]